MKRTIFVAVIVVLAVGALGYTIRRVFFNQSVVTTGYLQPEAVTQLNFATTAPITEITVQVGDVVRGGDVLAKQVTRCSKQRSPLAVLCLADQVALQYQQDPYVPQDLQAAELANAARQAQLDAAQAKASETVGVQDSLVTRAASGCAGPSRHAGGRRAAGRWERGRLAHGPGRERDGQPVSFRSWLRRHRADHAPAGHRGGTQPGAHELVQPARPPDHSGPGVCDRGGGRLRPGGGEAAIQRGTAGRR